MEEYQNPEVLRKLYWEGRLSLRQVAKKLGTYNNVILYWMMKNDIKRREALRINEKLKISKETLEELYSKKGLSCQKIAELFNTTNSTITRKLMKYNIRKIKSYVFDISFETKKNKMKEFVYPNLDAKKLAEFIGILLGDGCIRKEGISVTLNKDEISYAYYIKNLVFDLFGINGKIRFKKNENTLIFYIYSASFVDFLINKLGLVLSPKKNRAMVPNYIIGTELEKYLLRGLFDTDGCFTITNNNGTPYIRIELKAQPSPMRGSLIGILKRRGFQFGVYEIENKNNRIQLNGFSQFYKWIRKIGTKNPKQMNKIKNFIIAGTGNSRTKILFEPVTSRFPKVYEPCEHSV